MNVIEETWHDLNLCFCLSVQVPFVSEIGQLNSLTIPLQSYFEACKSFACEIEICAMWNAKSKDALDYLYTEHAEGVGLTKFIVKAETSMID